VNSTRVPAVDRLGDLADDARNLVEERDVTEIFEVGRRQSSACDR